MESQRLRYPLVKHHDDARLQDRGAQYENSDDLQEGILQELRIVRGSSAWPWRNGLREPALRPTSASWEESIVPTVSKFEDAFGLFRLRKQMPNLHDHKGVSDARRPTTGKLQERRISTVNCSCQSRLVPNLGSIALEPEYNRNPGRQVQPRYDSAIFLTSELFAKERPDQRFFVPSCGDSEQFLPNQPLLANQSQWAQRDSVPNREAAPRRCRRFKTPQARRKRLPENNVLIQDTTVFSRVPT